jgi:outer membrane protein assembly factor BamA
MIMVIAIKGTKAVCIDSILREKLPIPYDAGMIKSIADKTIYYLGCKGYPFSRMSIDISDTICQDLSKNDMKDKGTVVTFLVFENGRYAYSQPVISGKITTSTKLLKRDISINPGNVVDMSKISETRIRLLSRKYISSVETGQLKIIRNPDIAGTYQADSSAKIYNGSVMVPLLITENTGLGIDGAIAYQSGSASGNSITGAVNISLLNIFHYGENGTLTYKGETDYQNLSVSVGVPYLFGVPVFGDAGFGLEIKQDDYGYLHGELALTTDLWPFWQWGLSLNGHEATTYVDSVAENKDYAGLDFILTKDTKPYRAGVSCSEASFKIGSGMTYYDGARLTRWHVDLGYGLHLPLNFRHAFVVRLAGGSILTSSMDTLFTAELYKLGGHSSMRGYTENEFAFSSFGYGQAEYHYYFSYAGSVYIFTDGGAGMKNRSTDETSKAIIKMMGYGAGIRIPVKIGDAAVEWARNYKDTESWGRIHVSIRNSISASTSN